MIRIIHLLIPQWTKRNLPQRWNEILQWFLNKYATCDPGIQYSCDGRGGRTWCNVAPLNSTVSVATELGRETWIINKWQAVDITYLPCHCTYFWLWANSNSDNKRKNVTKSGKHLWKLESKEKRESVKQKTCLQFCQTQPPHFASHFLHSSAPCATFSAMYIV